MEVQPIIYAKAYDDDDGSNWLSLYRGIYNTNRFPVLKRIGCVNITQRVFYKQAKHSKKIARIEGNNISLYRVDSHIEEGAYQPIQILFTQFGYANELLNDVINIIESISNNNSIKTNNSNRTGGEMDGIVAF